MIPDQTENEREAAADGVPCGCRLAGIAAKAEPTIIRAGSLVIGGNHLGMIAGPCAVESQRQLLDAAHAVKAAGATALRGGAFKARTSPYSFQGLKEDGLKILAAARDETGLAFVTEVVCANDVPLVARYADVLQIGARNMQNFRLLLKRGPSATLEELLLAAEYILDAGNPHVALCERGIRTFEAHTRYTLSLSAIPWLHQRTHLPVVADPSHGTGQAALVTSMAAAAVAAGADGLLVEVHPQPASALSDGQQSLDFEQFGTLMAVCRRVAEAIGKPLDRTARHADPAPLGDAAMHRRDRAGLKAA